MAKHLSASEASQIIAEYTAGATMRQLADAYQRTPAAICKLLKRSGVPARDKSECQKPILTLLRGKTGQFGEGHTVLDGWADGLAIAVIDPVQYHVGAIMERTGMPHSKATRYFLMLRSALALKGQSLLLVWKDELDKPGFINLLLHKTNKHKAVCYARETVVRPVGLSEAVEFYNKYHIQGRMHSGATLGLAYEGRLVACMSFSLGNTCRGDPSAHLLSRFAVAGSVPGAASKLLKHYLRENPGQAVISYSDERYAQSGGLYKRLGFHQVATYKPDYRYWRDGRWYAKNAKQKKHLCTELLARGDSGAGMTEFEMANKLGYLRCYDCGKISWRLDSK